MAWRSPSLAARGVGAAVALALSTVVVSAAAQHTAKVEPLLPVLPLSVAIVADDEGRAARDDAWIDAQIAQAERLFAPHGVHFRKVRTRALPPRFARLETRDDRDALAAECDKGVVNVFIVASLRDVDEPERFRQGVHWRSRSAPAKHYAIVSAVAQPTTMAHELGHFFGNPHSAVVDNLMSYERTSVEATFLDERQGKKSRQLARLYLGSRELWPDGVEPPKRRRAGAGASGERASP